MAEGLKKRIPCPKGCRYQMADGACDYLCQAGQGRGCPPGPDCTRYEPAEGYQPKPVRPPQPRRQVEGYTRRPTARQSLEADPKVLEMYQAGATDGEIADATGWSKRTVCKWRQGNGLPGNRKNTPIRDREEEAVRLYEAGCSDNQIAGTIGCSAKAVWDWRKRTGRKANHRQGWQKKGENHGNNDHQHDPGGAP